MIKMFPMILNNLLIKHSKTLMESLIVVVNGLPKRFSSYFPLSISYESDKCL